MDFSLGEAQTELAGLARKILVERDTAERQWADLAAAGVLAAGLPEPLGGAGLGFLEQCSVLAEVGRATSQVPYLASVVLGAGAIASFGHPDQQRRWAGPAGDGSLVLTAALSEEDGDDPSSPSARAERDGGRWRLSGVKTAVPAAARADLMLVPATAASAEAASTADEVLVFLVEPSDNGVTVQPQALTDGADAGRLILDGVALDDSRVLGPRGRGAEIANWLVSRGTVGLCAEQAGVAERALELTTQYARSREQFGRPIGSFQAVAQRLADAYIDVEAVRLTMWQAAWLLAARPPDDAEVAAAVATAKFWAADAGHRVAHTAVHVHGGMGIDTSYPVHRYFTAAKRAEFTLGGATAQLRRLGDLLATALPPMRRMRIRAGKSEPERAQGSLCPRPASRAASGCPPAGGGNPPPGAGLRGPRGPIMRTTGHAEVIRRRRWAA
ncbi:MAG: acyl-CoA dehydrogenase family protein [Trebonia sp.]